MQMEEFVTKTMRKWVKRKSRYPVEVDVILFRADGRKSSARLKDLSDGGCKMETVSLFAVDERILISIPRMGMIKAKIQWIAPDEAGAKFIIEADF